MYNISNQLKFKNDENLHRLCEENRAKLFLSAIKVAGEDRSATNKKMTQPCCTKMVISQLLLHVASSNLVGRKSKWYFITKFSLLLSLLLCWREIRPDVGKTTENKFVASFVSIDFPKKRIKTKLLCC